MGWLVVGTPLNWPETKAASSEARQKGIEQFIRRYLLTQNVVADKNLWGDEIECTLVQFDHENKKVRALLKAAQLLELIETVPGSASQLWQPEYTDYMIEGVPKVPYKGLYGCVLEVAPGGSNKGNKVRALLKAAQLLELIETVPGSASQLWQPEYTDYMIEGVPKAPYKGLYGCVLEVEANLRRRRLEIQRLLGPNEAIMTLGNFPMTGCPGFTVPRYEPNPESSVSKSCMFPDEAIQQNNPHFIMVTDNLVSRRGEKTSINIPIYRDHNTPNPFVDPCEDLQLSPQDLKHRLINCIFLDSMPFGPSCCCLQTTFQTETLQDAMKLKDHLIPLCPIILALTAATPIFKGYLSNVDCRWNVLKAAVDDRTDEERGLIPLENERYHITTSRCDSVDMYLLPKHSMYSDVGIPFCADAFDEMVEGGVEPLFAEYMAHLFIRDPMQLYRESLDSTDVDSLDLFECVHLFHWRTLRLKLPPADKESGWKVEFRPSEIQATDFQNAAVCVFVFILTRLILEDQLHTIMPISLVFRNMTFAQKRDAINTARFFFRISTDSEMRHMSFFDQINGNGNGNGHQPHAAPRKRRMSIDEESACFSLDAIINGREKFVGLAKMAENWIADRTDLASEQKNKLFRYVKFIRMRASGQLNTVASWMRNFVKTHPAYMHDSVVSEEIAYDMLLQMHNASNGVGDCTDLVGEFA